jgi:hypothetical protein
MLKSYLWRSDDGFCLTSLEATIGKGSGGLVLLNKKAASLNEEGNVCVVSLCRCLSNDLVPV